MTRLTIVLYQLHGIRGSVVWTMDGAAPVRSDFQGGSGRKVVFAGEVPPGATGAHVALTLVYVADDDGRETMEGSSARFAFVDDGQGTVLRPAGAVSAAGQDVAGQSPSTAGPEVVLVRIAYGSENILRLSVSRSLGMLRLSLEPE